MSTMPDLSRVEWVKSSYSNGNEGQCVEFTPSIATYGVVPVRDSKDPIGPALIFSTDAWVSFTAAIQRGDFPAI